MNLLQMALAHEKDQWYMSESIWLVKNCIFLKAYRGEVRLCLVGYPADVLIWWLDPLLCQWVQARDLEKQYTRWAENAQVWYKMKKQKRKGK